MKIRNFIISAVILSSIAITAGCGRSESYGALISNRNITAIGDILIHPEQYDGKTVTVKGKIAIECETGCWFNFKDGDAVIYVNLEPSGIAIPQRSGRAATVQGNITIKEGKPVLIGKGVQIQ